MDKSPNPIPTIDVAIGLIFNAEGHILVALRPKHAIMGGFWEFPGGKLESGEQVFDCLVRELHEEIGISVEQADALEVFTHAYPDRKVVLHVWRVVEFFGEPHGAEGQEVRWVSVNQLSALEFLAANHPIVGLVQASARSI